MSSQQHFQGVQENLPVIQDLFFKTFAPSTTNNFQVIKKPLKNNGLSSKLRRLHTRDRKLGADATPHAGQLNT
jgi:hypothetical protein